MNEIIVNPVSKLKFRIFPVEKRRKRVLGSDIEMSPVEIRFYKMHAVK